MSCSTRLGTSACSIGSSSALDLLQLEDPLAPLLAPLSDLRGVGPKLVEKLARLTGGERVRDLLFHLPDTFIDRRLRSSIKDSVPGQVVSWVVELAGKEPPRQCNHPWRVRVTDGTAFAELAIWDKHRLGPVIQASPGSAWLVNGRVETFGGRFSMRDPKYVLATERASSMPAIDPIWPLTKRLSSRELQGAIAAAAQHVPELPEWHDPSMLRRHAWPSFRAALVGLQVPAELPPATLRSRLEYDEMLAHQLAVAWMKTRGRNRPGRSLSGDGTLRADALRRFNLPLTASQERALGEISADLAAPRRMIRLLQGDVGSGKTLVAILAMLAAVEAGAQAALMVPTEVLAQQHLRTLKRLAPCRVGLLTSSVRGMARRELLLGLAAGHVPIVIGTHALFQDAVEFSNLGLAVIDEQHRFGVEQRLMLGDKGEEVNLLVMTATPIPRTLLLTHCGDMDVSRLSEKPSNRRAIRTSLHSLTALNAVIEAIGRAMSRGEQVYWVCPLVTESMTSDLTAAQARFTDLHARFGAGVVLAHGQQESATRDAALASFAAGQTRLLVTTTIVEVGVDVPGATVMVIEHAERFGLAQLHQLRGRVGRDATQSYCLLLHGDGLTETERQRLLLLRDTEDGFVIAEEDHRLRGGGDPLGKRQSGLRSFRLATPDAQDKMLHVATQDAAVLLQRDPDLKSERGQAARLLLRLFDRGAAMETLAAG